MLLLGASKGSQEFDSCLAGGGEVIGPPVSLNVHTHMLGPTCVALGPYFSNRAALTVSAVGCLPTPNVVCRSSFTRACLLGGELKVPAKDSVLVLPVAVYATTDTGH